MTIYKGKTKKFDNKLSAVRTDDAVVPLTQSEFGKNEESFHSPGIRVFRNNTQDCERRFMRICAVLAVLTVFAVATCLGYLARQKLFSCKPFIETIHVRFHEYRRHSDDLNLPESRIEGGFFEQVEIDWKTKQYEKINVPPFIDVKSATIVHDFVYMWTAIVDRDNSQCFVIPLNRSITFPPEIFMDYVKDQQKLGIRYNGISFKAERQVYKVITPHLETLMELGNVIFTECRYYDTYRLVKADEPIAMSKRFACQFSGKTYSLGGAGHPILVLIALDGCL